MIKSYADLLEELKKKGVLDIQKATNPAHTGMIGDMYEGLTSKLLSKAIFKKLDLRVVSGKITNNDKHLSKQIDCMIVNGEGEKMPFSKNYIYHSSKVIAVIEVKKTLNKQQLESSTNNLQSVINVSYDHNQEDYMYRILKKSWEGLTDSYLPTELQLDNLPDKLKSIHKILCMEAYLPVRIVFGYFGYKSEYTLREGFIKIFKERIKSGNYKNFGVGNLPNLIICGENSIIKNNGMPFGIPLQKQEHYWPILVSANASPLRNLLEVIWSRIAFKFRISNEIFDDEIELDAAHAFVDCKFEIDKGWEYFYYQLTKEDLTLLKPSKKYWSPVEIDEVEFKVILLLNMFNGKMSVEDKDLLMIMSDYGVSADKVIEGLFQKRIVITNNKVVKFGMKQCTPVMFGDKYYAGDMANPLMKKWIKNFGNS